MNRTPYVLSVVIATLLAWVSWLLVLGKMSPFISGLLALALFYASFFVALMGTFALLIYYLRLWLSGNPEGAFLNIALREGFFLSVMITVGFIFQRLRVLTWWDALLLLAIVVLMEFYFLSHD